MALEENVVSDKQEAYIAWLVTAPSGRNPKFKQDFASTIGVDQATLHRWEKREVFKRAWALKVDDVVGSPERTQMLLDRLFSDGMAGSDASAKLYFQVTGKMAPQPMAVTVQGAGVGALTDAELDAMIAAGAASERETRSKL